jgi:pimeloyl-ACP methyl ester carboxylesterase
MKLTFYVRCYAELFTTAPFTHMIFVDQSPLMYSTLDGWDSRFCGRTINNPSNLAQMQAALRLTPEIAYKASIALCLAYNSHPLPTDNVSMSTVESDESFFLAVAQKGDPIWHGKLMADHAALDWRDSICANFGDCDNETKVLVIASSRSGYFPPEGLMKIVELINSGHDRKRAKGEVIEWGGHYCHWENPERFNELVLAFLKE